jgi:hypothetical protein
MVMVLLVKGACKSVRVVPGTMDPLRKMAAQYPWIGPLEKGSVSVLNEAGSGHLGSVWYFKRRLNANGR